MEWACLLALVSLGVFNGLRCRQRAENNSAGGFQGIVMMVVV